MRIGVSLLNFRPGRIGGAETYIRKLVELMPKQAGSDEIIFFVTPENRSFVPDGCEIHCFDHSDAYIVALRLIEAFAHIAPRKLKKMFHDAMPDVILFPQQALFPVISDIPSVLIVADTQHIDLPQYFSTFTRLYRNAIYDRSLHHTDGIIAISQFTADRVNKCYDINREKIRPVRLGMDLARLDTTETIPPKIDGPYYYFPAASYPHKGHEKLFRSLAKLRNNDNKIHKVVLTGQKTRYWKKIEKLIHELNLHDIVEHLGFVSQGEVMGLYANRRKSHPRQYNNRSSILFGKPYFRFSSIVATACQYQQKAYRLYTKLLSLENPFLYSTACIPYFQAHMIKPAG